MLFFFVLCFRPSELREPRARGRAVTDRRAQQRARGTWWTSAGARRGGAKIVLRRVVNTRARRERGRQRGRRLGVKRAAGGGRSCQHSPEGQRGGLWRTTASPAAAGPTWPAPESGSRTSPLRRRDEVPHTTTGGGIARVPNNRVPAEQGREREFYFLKVFMGGTNCSFGPKERNWPSARGASRPPNTVW